MKYLNTYKLFEDKEFGNWKITNLNKDKEFTKKDYQELADTLQVEIFDEFNIRFLSDDEYDKMDEEGLDILETLGKYWEYSYDFNGKMSRQPQININGLTSKETKLILKELEEIKPIVFGRSNLKYIYSHFPLNRYKNSIIINLIN